MGRSEFEDEQEALKGIASTLLALAALAEFLCVQSFPVRVLVLWLLRPAEAVARAFAAEHTGGRLAVPVAAVRETEGDSCAEALRLSLCFRALASIFRSLRRLLARHRPFSDRPQRRLRQCASALAWLSHLMPTHRHIASCRAGRIDTS